MPRITRARSSHIASSLILAGLLGGAAQAQEAPAVETPATAEKQEQAEEKRPVRPEDYGKWESLGFGSALSPDGKWLAYQIRRVDGESELRIKMLAADSEEVVEYGGRPTFSDDSNWVTYSIGISDEERERLQSSGRSAPSKIGVRNLTTGEEEVIEGVTSASFSEGSQYLIMRRSRIEGRSSSGVDVIIRDIQTGIDTNFGNVGDSAWNEDGTLLAMVIDAEDKAGNGIQLFDTSTGTLRTLDSKNERYKGLTWREESTDLAVMREMTYEDNEDITHAVIMWSDLAGIGLRREFDPTKATDFPAEMRIVDYSGLRWSDDGATLFFGIKQWQDKPKALTDEAAAEEQGEAADASEDGKGEETQQPAARERSDEKKPKTLRETIDTPSNVEVWHADDIDIIPLQKRRDGQIRRDHFLGAWHHGTRTFVQISNDLTESARLLDEHRYAIGLDNTPYEEEKKFGPTVNDVYIIDLATGERTKVLDRVKYVLDGSPTGEYFLFVRDEHVWSFDIANGQAVNLTADAAAKFINQEMSNLTDEKPPYGTTGWTEDGKHVYLNDRYDIYRFAIDGSEHARVTFGADDQVRHRRVVLDREEEEFIVPGEPMLVSLYGDTTKKSGYGIVQPDGHVDHLLWNDSSIGRLTKAEEAPVYMYVEQRFDDSPDIFTTDAGMQSVRQVTATNSFQDDYLWGHSELVDYTSQNGDELQGALFYPADYEPGKQYPMIVYIYEMRSQVLHNYSTPSETNPYNPAVFTAEGYFVYQPDIVYRAQNPGVSAVECVVPAVEKVLETGMIDEDRVGLIGHSWGAYQTAFIVTQTDLFAAGVAGAPLTNMMSMSMSIYWNSGQTDAWIFHESQGRMDRPFWQDVDTYIKNSPIFNIDDMNTPLMIAFGDDDGAVDFNQGVEMYNAARLAGKQFIMLVYPGENHSLRREENQVDYHYRILEWFSHYLRGEEAESWITDGLSWRERQEQIEKMRSGNRGNGAGARGPRGRR